jgi:hypothetical protein
VLFSARRRLEELHFDLRGVDEHARHVGDRFRAAISIGSSLSFNASSVSNR